MQDINLPDFIAFVAEQIKEANVRANQRIRETNDDPFLGLQDVQLQIAFTAEESKTKGGTLELKPWVFSAGGSLTNSSRNAIVHTVTLNLTPALAESATDESQEQGASSVGGGRGGGGGGLSNRYLPGPIVYSPER
jgi:hypothetical protein